MMMMMMPQGQVMMMQAPQQGGMPMMYAPAGAVMMQQPQQPVAPAAPVSPFFQPSPAQAAAAQAPAKPDGTYLLACHSPVLAALLTGVANLPTTQRRSLC